MAAGNKADRHARLQRLIDDQKLLLRREPPPAGNTGDDFHLRKRLGLGVCLGLCLAPPANAGVRSEWGAVQWALVLMAARPDDELYDLFLGTGAVEKAWRTWRGKFTLPPFELAAEQR